MIWRDRVDVIVQLGLRGESVGEMVWDVSDWDDPSSTWGGIEPTFTELDGWSVESVATARGRTAANRRHPAGTCTVVLVWGSPAGKWSFRPTAPVQLGQELRVLARPRDTAGVPIADPLPIFRGAVRAIADGWQPAKGGQMLFRVTVQLVDRLAELAAVNLPERPLEGLGDLTHERISRILEMANVNAFYLRAGVCVVEHQSSNFARNLLDEAQVTVEGEVGELYVDREGFIVVRERAGEGSYPRESAAQLVWSNSGDAGTIGPIGFGTGSDIDDVVNQVSMARSGGTAYTAGGPSTDSAIRYGLRTYQRFDLTVRFDADVEFAADYWLAQLAERTQRVDQLRAAIDPHMPDARLLELLDIELGDRHSISWSDGEQMMAGDLHVQGVAHTISGASWSISVNLWAHAGEGLEPVVEPAVWGSAVWGESQWGAG